MNHQASVALAYLHRVPYLAHLAQVLFPVVRNQALAAVRVLVLHLVLLLFRVAPVAQVFQVPRSLVVHHQALLALQVKVVHQVHLAFLALASPVRVLAQVRQDQVNQVNQVAQYPAVHHQVQSQVRVFLARQSLVYQVHRACRVVVNLVLQAKAAHLAFRHQARVLVHHQAATRQARCPLAPQVVA